MTMLYARDFTVKSSHLETRTRINYPQGCRGYGDSHGDSHGYGYGIGMGTVMNPHGFCG